jgi:hypothetical protein
MLPDTDPELVKEALLFNRKNLSTLKVPTVTASYLNLYGEVQINFDQEMFLSEAIDDAYWDIIFEC